jgi:adenylate kinase family enzyme
MDSSTDLYKAAAAIRKSRQYRRDNDTIETTCRSQKAGIRQAGIQKAGIQQAGIQKAGIQQAARPSHRKLGEPLTTWVDPLDAYSGCDVTAAEYDAAAAAARKDLLKGKRPVAEGVTPHLLITIGAPGVGKSTVSGAIASKRGAGDDYVTVDLDTAVKYHPRYSDIWAVPSAATGNPAGVGYTLGYLSCNASLGDLLLRIYEDIIFAKGPRYNVILQAHTQVNIILAKLAGFRVTLLFVGTPLATAQARSRTRAITTGKFLAANLAAQDEVVESMWVDYRLTAAWYGMWADEFLVADNRRGAATDEDASKNVLRRVKSIPLHGADWDVQRRAAQDAVNAACSP